MPYPHNMVHGQRSQYVNERQIAQLTEVCVHFDRIKRFLFSSNTGHLWKRVRQVSLIHLELIIFLILGNGKLLVMVILVW